MLTIVVAMSENRVIGKDGALPWHLPGDLVHFKKTTMGKPIIMGRKTFDSLEKPLSGRVNIIVSRNPDFQVDGAMTSRNLVEAIEKAMSFVGDDGEICILGGAEIYRQALPIADRLCMTHVHANVEGDTFFPEFDPAQWSIISEERHEADDRNRYAFTIRTYERAKK